MTAIYELVTSLHDGAGNFMQNVFHYELTEAGSGSPYDYAKELIDAWVSANEVDYLNLLGTDVILDFYNAKKVTAGGGPSAVFIRAFPGTGPGSSVSSAFAADVAWISGAPSNRPAHTFLGGIYDQCILNGQWQAGFITKIGVFITSMLTPLTLAGAFGTATFVQFTRKTLVGNDIKHGILRPKPTGVNRRTLPVI